jgi:hypothetical protein
MKVPSVITLLACVAIGAVAGFAIGRTVGVEPPIPDPSVKTLDEFCTATWMAMEQDAADLRSETLEVREAAYARFYVSPTMWHNAPSLHMCIREPLSYPSGCSIRKDLPCLAKAAERYAALLLPARLR